MLIGLRLVAFVGCLPLACGSSSDNGGRAPSSQAGHDPGGSATAGAGAQPDNSGGSAGSSAGAPAVEALVQDVALGTIPRNAQVLIKGVFVTGKKGVGSDFWIQEPVGVTTPDVEYPRHAGLQVFPEPKTTDLQFAVQRLKVGDCIDVTGRVSRFGGYPEVDNIEALVMRDPGSCGVLPEPIVIDTDAAFARIISDADPNRSDPQPAADAVAYNGLVLRVTSLTVKDTRVTGEHVLERAGSSGFLAVFRPLQDGVYAIATGQTFSAITGVYTNGVRLSTEFGLAPRTVNDLEP